ncbi:uncharacterized protein LY28_02366 [Ruminiclostridium sufflavum DSM 19573]|uniref:Radical SAM core domain-containing protein n=1 Tax=Ruminiclostridium sufflavum DSM 19573 TaxID=1121337 RepID=A0A318XL91_9FIRM|nr:TIGR04463 family radical SAM/SPASM RiPP maturase [Ruminiclostridium sufflavum]PYG87228.1 uncharacterized protein LY28_02366 [Ruminiclostridium sufflavum DSM 19573]
MNSTKYISSRYNVLIPLKEERVLAYNSLTGSLALWEKEDSACYYDTINGTGEDESSVLLIQLLHCGFIIKKDYDELFALEKEYRMHRYDRSSMILTIAPTMACNFGCDYCFQGKDKPTEEMSIEVQDAIVELIRNAASSISRLHIAWYGGEPLIKPSVINALSKRVIEICSRHRIRYDSMIVTNGYMLDLNSAKLLYEAKVNLIQITLDGPADYHDTRRTLLSGAPTFNRIVNNIKDFIDIVPITVNIRVNIDYRNKSGIEELLDSLRETGLSNKINLKLYFAPIEAITSGCHNIAEQSMTKSEYGLLEAELFSKAYKYGLVNLPYPPRFKGTCAATRPRGFVIIPNGDVHKCWDTVSLPERKIGTVFEPDYLDTDQTHCWHKWSPFEYETCRSCILLPVCAGACAYKFIYSNDTLGEAAASPCISWKYNINEQLIFRAVQLGIIGCEDYVCDSALQNIGLY